MTGYVARLRDDAPPHEHVWLERLYPPEIEVLKCQVAGCTTFETDLPEEERP